MIHRSTKKKDKGYLYPSCGSSIAAEVPQIQYEDQIVEVLNSTGGWSMVDSGGGKGK